MIVCLSLWNLIVFKDICTYQQNRYQKDRYLMSISLNFKIIFYWMVGCCVSYWLYNQDQMILFDLINLMILSYSFKLNQKYIVELIITSRIKRLFILILFFDILLLLCYWYFNLIGLFLIISFLYFHHETFYIFVILVHPMEMKIRKRYVEKAKRKLKKYKGIIIGITGSYGKTSIKNLLYDVCSMKYSCLKTRASYNNEMGITKTILEELNHQEIFICEMGADHLHEIEDLCKFVKPTIGIVSSVGPQHLSTFKTLQNVFHEKIKLLESLPKTGIGFYNFDNYYLHELDTSELNCLSIQIGIHQTSKIQAINIEVDHLGSQFDVILDHQKVHFATKLLGEHNIYNCLFAIGVAYYLKIDPVLIQIAINSTKPVEHRLELKPFSKGMCIDNAYNSNPESARCALDVLKQMPHNHYVITPGFIDLGEHHCYYSHEFGKQLSFCDLVMLVGECKEIEKGLMDAGYSKDKIIHQKTMKLALSKMAEIMKEKDTLLIENDIPELLMNT